MKTGCVVIVIIIVNKKNVLSKKEDEEEIVSSSLMTYGIPTNSDINPSEYIRNRIEEMTRNRISKKGLQKKTTTKCNSCAWKNTEAMEIIR